MCVRGTRREREGIIEAKGGGAHGHIEPSEREREKGNAHPVCCWANAHTLPHGFWGRSLDGRLVDEDGSSSVCKTGEKCAQERGGMEVLSLSYYLLYYISNKVDKLGWKKREKMGNETWKTTTTRGSAKRAFSNGIFVVEPANRGWERAQSFHGTYIDSTAGNTQRKPLFFFFFPLYAYIRCIIHFSLYLILSSQFVVVPYFETGNCCLEPTDTT